MHSLVKQNHHTIDETKINNLTYRLIYLQVSSIIVLMLNIMEHMSIVWGYLKYLSEILSLKN